MPVDAAFPFERDSSGDLKSVDEEDFFYNHALQLAHIAAGDISGEGLTAADIRGAESDIENVIADSPFFDAPVRVRVEESDRDVLKADVTVSNINENLELPLDI